MTWRRWFGRDEQETALEKELTYHIEERVAEFVRSGVSEEDARRRVRMEFGAAEQVKDECRDVRPAHWLETFLRDVRYAWRNLRRNPGFAAVAIATLALGIGGLTAMFSAVDTILIRPLPYAEPDRLVMVWDDLSKTDDRTKSDPAPAEWYEWRRLNTVFRDIASTEPTDATLSGDAAPEQIPARKATGNLWNVLGVRPLIGRVFNEEEDKNGVRVAVISYGLWQRRYGGCQRDFCESQFCRALRDWRAIQVRRHRRQGLLVQDRGRRERSPRIWHGRSRAPCRLQPA